MILIEEGYVEGAQGKKHIRHSRTRNSFQFLVLPLFFRLTGYAPRIPANGKIPSRVIVVDHRREKGSSGELTRNRARYNDVLLPVGWSFQKRSGYHDNQSSLCHNAKLGSKLDCRLYTVRQTEVSKCTKKRRKICIHTDTYIYIPVYIDWKWRRKWSSVRILACAST